MMLIVLVAHRADGVLGRKESAFVDAQPNLAAHDRRQPIGFRAVSALRQRASVVSRTSACFFVTKASSDLLIKKSGPHTQQSRGHAIGFTDDAAQIGQHIAVGRRLEHLAIAAAFHFKRLPDGDQFGVLALQHFHRRAQVRDLTLKIGSRVGCEERFACRLRHWSRR